MRYSPSSNGSKRQRLQQQHILVSKPARKRAAECHVHSQAAAAQPPSAQQDTHRWATFVSRHGNIWTAVEEASQGALSGFGPESGESASRKLVQDLHNIGLAPQRIHAAVALCSASRAGQSEG